MNKIFVHENCSDKGYYISAYLNQKNLRFSAHIKKTEESTETIAEFEGISLVSALEQARAFIDGYEAQSEVIASLNRIIDSLSNEMAKLCNLTKEN